jgi:uncharacterized protein (UPF0335 family)
MVLFNSLVPEELKDMMRRIEVLEKEVRELKAKVEIHHGH